MSSISFMLNLNILFAQNNIDSLKLEDKAPTFFLNTLNGDGVFLSDFCGKLRQPWKNKTQHIVVLSFFATWCKPYLTEIPSLEKISEKYHDRNLRIFLVNLKESKEILNKFLSTRHIQMPTLMDRYGVVAKKYNVKSLPKLFIIGKDGKIKFIKSGYDENIFEIVSKKIESLLR